MSSESIYAILASKPHNPHYLKRYFKFIQWCQRTPSGEDYTEEHHICPKAGDLFPEYINFKEHDWNKIDLSFKQHLIAHIILWKAYGGSQALAMRCIFNSKHWMDNRKIPTVIELRYAAKARLESRLSQLGKSCYVDEFGTKYYLHRDNPLINEFNLVSVNANREVTQARLDADEKLSEFWMNRMRYMSQDGVYHGSYLKDDPIIQELNLVPLRTQAQIDQNASRTAVATEARTGSNIYNNGIEEKFLLEPIDESWVLGRLPYSEEGRNNQIIGTREACLGTKTYNNGKVNMFIKDGEHIPEGFKPGGKCRPNTTYWYIKDDRSDVISFLGQHDEPDGYFFSNERDAGVVLRLNRESEMNVVDKDSAISFVEYCMYNGKFNVNRSELFTKHNQSICDIYGLSTSLKNPTIAKHVLTGSEIKKCRCCGTHIEDSMIYCSNSCDSKMKYK